MSWKLACLLAFVFLNSRACSPGGTEGPEKVRVAFYNVENLFDTVNDPKTDDDQFLPESEKKWDGTKYQKKLTDISKVLKRAGEGEFPPLIGLCEVENEKVLKDLISEFGENHPFKFIHKDSPDERGIDVALIYRTDIFKPLERKFFQVDLEGEFKHDRTRDVLLVKGELRGERIFVFVNHWSSRFGGVSHSQPKRITAATVVKKEIDKILAKDQDSKIILIGDFNDEPTNESVLNVLGADTLLKTDRPGLVNLSYHLQKNGEGTYKYRQNWDVLDQIIVSNGFLNARSGWTAQAEGARILKEPWMVYNSKKYGPQPNKTYGGPNYYGGYSDHFPTYTDLYLK